MLNQQIILEILWMFVLAFYAIFVFFITKRLYDWMLSNHIKKSVAIYYNRKVIHILAGGVVVLAVPFLFSSLESLIENHFSQSPFSQAQNL